MGMLLAGALAGGADAVSDISENTLKEMAAARIQAAKDRTAAAGLKARADEGDKDRASREKIAADNAAAKKDKDSYYNVHKEDKHGNKSTESWKRNKGGTSSRTIPDSEKQAYSPKQRRNFEAAYDRVPSEVPENERANYAYHKIKKSNPDLQLKPDTYESMMGDYRTRMSDQGTR